MKLKNASNTILLQLEEVVGQIKEQDFSRQLPTLSNATIGQHVRHTLEFFICLEEGLQSGVVNYDNRGHDHFMESDKFIALNAITNIRKFISDINSNTSLQLEVGYDPVSDGVESMETNLYRELTYNLEHAVHHMAILKIGIREAAPYIQLPGHFGVASSTIKHKKEQTEISQ